MCTKYIESTCVRSEHARCSPVHVRVHVQLARRMRIVTIRFAQLNVCVVCAFVLSRRLGHLEFVDMLIPVCAFERACVCVCVLSPQRSIIGTSMRIIRRVKSSRNVLCDRTRNQTNTKHGHLCCYSRLPATHPQFANSLGRKCHSRKYKLTLYSRSPSVRVYYACPFVMLAVFSKIKRHRRSL